MTIPEGGLFDSKFKEQSRSGLQQLSGGQIIWLPITRSFLYNYSSKKYNAKYSR
ncbi:hypothetical protein DCCM_2763 [Desulfocucumis palustris]|uniref:Uncharacterized protein n=1 Tax=Desulfocucumis palustris TaxID=1898651 RepID=A0A2L2XBH1_9FIRM|nr:hypothetical protein DCCM_2763 [Desulfocucumis palustris]